MVPDERARARRSPVRLSHVADPSPWRVPGTAARRELVDVVEQRRRLHQPPIAPRAPRSARAGRQPRRHVRDGAVACRTNHAGGSREHSRRAASRRSGIVMGTIVPVGTAQSPVPGSRPARARRRPGSRGGRERRPGRDRDRARERGRAGDAVRRADRTRRRRVGRPRDPAGRRRGPLVRTVSPLRRARSSTEPSWSVRRVRAPRRGAGERRRRGVAVRVAGARRGDRDPRPDRIEERLGGRGRAAVVGDLEQVDARQAAREQRRVDALLDVAREQEPPPVRLAQQHDRDVVDPRSRCPAARPGPCPDRGHRTVHARPRRAGAGRRLRATPRGGPSRSTASQAAQPGPGPRMPGSYTRPTRVPLEDPGEARDVVLVGMGEDDDVEAPVPRRDPLVERDEDPVRVGAAVDEHPGAGPGLEQDRVALPDVQHGDPGGASGRIADGRAAERDDDRARRRAPPAPARRDGRPASGHACGRRRSAHAVAGARRRRSRRSAPGAASTARRPRARQPGAPPPAAA